MSQLHETYPQITSTEHAVLNNDNFQCILSCSNSNRVHPEIYDRNIVLQYTRISPDHCHYTVIRVMITEKILPCIQQLSIHVHVLHVKVTSIVSFSLCCYFLNPI